MNRKLLNGLLVLAVAAGGVGTFTSCKDEETSNDLLVGQIDLQGQIDAIRALDDKEFRQNLQKWLDDQCTPEFDDFADLVQKAAAMYTIYDDIMNNYPNISSQTEQYISNLYDWMENNLFPESDWYKEIYLNKAGLELQKDLMKLYQNKLNSLVTSININQTHNPVFGTINLPVGLNSMMLANYVYSNNQEVVFPNDFNMALYDAEAYNDWDLTTLKSVIGNLTDGETIAAGVAFTEPASETDGNLGEAVITINPTNVNFAGVSNVQLVNSKGDVVLDGANDELGIKAYDDVLYFGATRDGETGGVYSLYANATADNWSALKLHLATKSELISAVKGAIKDHTISDIAHLGEVVYQSMNNVLPAYAVKVWWNEEVPVLDENGDATYNTVYYTDNTYSEVSNAETPYMKYEAITEEVENSVLSDFKLAATVIEPLAYTTGLGYGVNKQLPTFGPVAEMIDKYLGDFKFDLNIGEIGKVTGKDVDVVIDAVHNVVIDLSGMEVVDNDGNVIGTLGPDAKITLILTEEGTIANMEHVGDLRDFVSAIEDAVNTSVNDAIDEMIASINETIDDINTQLQNLQASVDNEINDLLNKIKNSSKLSYADKLVDAYNKVAGYVNKLIQNPNHYLQVMMAYNAGDGMHHVASVPWQYTVVPASSSVAGNPGLELFISSYNGDVLVPSYKKYVAITNAWVNGQQVAASELADLNAKAGPMINTVLPGSQQRIGMAVKDLVNYRVELTYMSLDYHGHVSMNHYYLNIR